MKKTLVTLICIIATVYGIYSQQPMVVMPSMVLVEGGPFQMGFNNGSSDEKPVHLVTLNSFFIGSYEVTMGEFIRFIDATGYLTDAEQPDSVRLKHGLPPRGINNGTWKLYLNGKPVPPGDSLKPVGNVSWNDAVQYCKWLSGITGKQFRLPTEAEWEYAARGGVKTKGYKFAGSNNLNEVAWFLDNSDRKVHNIGTKMANELNIYDKAGNHREWCTDWYGEFYYKTSPEENPAGPERGSNRVLRGGSWGSQGDRMRPTYRNKEFPYNSALDFGFRLAISGEPYIKKIPPPPPVPSDSGLLKDLDSKGFIDVYGINFDIGKSVVKAESYPIIDQIANYLKEHMNMRIMIEGHTDNTGTEAMNQTLSDKRALAIKGEIVKRGVESARMETTGFGASKPIADNKTAAGRTQNRRVTIKKL